jgi:hypothetical protein
MGQGGLGAGDLGLLGVFGGCFLGDGVCVVRVCTLFRFGWNNTLVIKTAVKPGTKDNQNPLLYKLNYKESVKLVSSIQIMINQEIF